MLEYFCASFSCNSSPCSGCSALHGANTNFKKLKLDLILPNPVKLKSTHYASAEEHTEDNRKMKKTVSNSK